MNASALSSFLLVAEEVDPEGNQAIGWTAGIFTAGLFIVVALLLWSFVRMARRARQPWETDEQTDVDPPKSEGDDAGPPQQ